MFTRHVIPEPGGSLSLDQLEKQAKTRDLHSISIDINASDMCKQNASFFLEEEPPLSGYAFIDCTANMIIPIVGEIPGEVMVKQELIDR